MLDVLLLLSVAQRLLERLDDVGRGGRDDHDGRLTVLADQLDRDVQALPRLGGLDDIIGDLLGGLGKATNKSAKKVQQKDSQERKSRGVKKKWIPDREDRFSEPGQPTGEPHHR